MVLADTDTACIATTLQRVCDVTDLAYLYLEKEGGWIQSNMAYATGVQNQSHKPYIQPSKARLGKNCIYYFLNLLRVGRNSHLIHCVESGQDNLGRLYFFGLGVRQDKALAKKLFGLACDNGFQTGCDNYKLLNN